MLCVYAHCFLDLVMGRTTLICSTICSTVHHHIVSVVRVVFACTMGVGPLPPPPHLIFTLTTHEPQLTPPSPKPTWAENSYLHPSLVKGNLTRGFRLQVFFMNLKLSPIGYSGARGKLIVENLVSDSL